MENTGVDSRIFRSLIKQALDNLDAKVAIYDNNNQLLWANKNFHNVFGEFPDRCLRTCLDHLHEDSNCPEYLISKTFETRTIQQGVFKIEDPGGQEIYYKVFNFPMFETDGSLDKIIQICWDITKASAYDALFSGQNALLQSLANASLDAILVLNHDLEIVFWNNGAKELLGYSIDDVMHKKYNMLLPDNFEAERDLKLMQQLLHAQGYVKNFETELVGSDGRNIKVELTYSFLNPENREQSGSYLIIRDTSARKNLEYIYRHTIDKLSKLHEIADLLHRSTSIDEINRAMLVSLTAGEGLRFNRAFLFMVNFENHELESILAIGPADPEEAGMIWPQSQTKSLREILDSYEIRDGFRDEIALHIAEELSTRLSNKSNILVKSVLKKRSYLVENNNTDTEFDPNICYIINNDTFAVVPILSKDIVVGVILVDNVFNREPILEKDIDALEIFAAQAGLAIENANLQSKLSDRLKELEDAYTNLQDSHEKLVRAERLATIGEVVAKVSHEIRNPLVNIGGFSNQLLKTSKKGSEEFRSLEIISNEALRLEKILENILNYSTVFQPNLELCNIRDLINKNILMVMDDLQKQNIAVNLEIDNSDCVILVDPFQLTQVFLNIFRNAMQAMTRGGKLSITTEKNEEYLVINIEDSGIGIRKKDLDKLFQPFYSTKSRGLGLGLPISLQILTHHGGKLEVTSRFRKGSKFSIHLSLKNVEVYNE